MAIIVKTNNAEYIRVKIPVLIKEGKIDTWEFDEDGDYTHVPEQWRNRAWMRAIVEEGDLIFYIIGRKLSNLSIEEYSVYHGRMAEMLMSHFSSYIEEITILPPFEYGKDTKKIER